MTATPPSRRCRYGTRVIRRHVEARSYHIGRYPTLHVLGLHVTSRASDLRSMVFHTLSVATKYSGTAFPAAVDSRRRQPPYRPPGLQPSDHGPYTLLSAYKLYARHSSHDIRKKAAGGPQLWSNSFRRDRKPLEVLSTSSNKPMCPACTMTSSILVEKVEVWLDASGEALLGYLAKIGKVDCLQMRRCSAIVALRAVEMPSGYAQTHTPCKKNPPNLLTLCSTILRCTASVPAGPFSLWNALSVDLLFEASMKPATQRHLAPLLSCFRHD